MALLIVSGGCSSKRHQHVWEERYIVAMKAQDRGELEEAEAHYAQLIAYAPDAEHRAAAEFKRATLLEGRGAYEEALTAYASLYSAEDIKGEGREYQARAIYRAARLLLDQVGDEARGEALLTDLLKHHGEWVAAEHALALLRMRYTTRLGGEGARDALEVYLEENEGKPLHGHILFALAELSGEDHARAMSYYQRVLEGRASSALWDDALWEIGAHQARLRDWSAALATYERLATDFQEESWFIGDYTSEHADAARLERARIYLQELGEPMLAVKEYERFLRDFEENRLRDDAAWMRLEALRAANATALYQEGVRAFLEEYPESRHVRQLKGGAP